MARMGNFSGATETYGVPLSYIHPKDNDFGKAKYHEIIQDARFGLNTKQKNAAQREVDEVFAALQVASGRKW